MIRVSISRELEKVTKKKENENFLFKTNIKKALVLFKGTGSVDGVLESMGYEVTSLDWLAKFKPTICCDILKLDYKAEFQPGEFDIVWGSPCCTNFSKNKHSSPEELAAATSLVSRTVDIINYLKPRLFFMENPETGKLKHQSVVDNIPVAAADYCQYHDARMCRFRKKSNLKLPYRKRSNFWSNIQGLVLRTCPGDTCEMMVLNPKTGRKVHLQSCGNGRKQYNQIGGFPTQEEKYRIPTELVRELLHTAPAETAYMTPFDFQKGSPVEKSRKTLPNTDTRKAKKRSHANAFAGSTRVDAGRRLRQHVVKPKNAKAPVKSIKALQRVEVEWYGKQYKGVVSRVKANGDYKVDFIFEKGETEFDVVPREDCIVVHLDDCERSYEVKFEDGSKHIKTEQELLEDDVSKSLLDLACSKFGTRFSYITQLQKFGHGFKVWQKHGSLLTLRRGEVLLLLVASFGKDEATAILKGAEDGTKHTITAAGGGCVDAALRWLGVHGTDFGAYTDLGTVAQQWDDTASDWQLRKFKGAQNAMQYVLEQLPAEAKCLAVVDHGGHCVAMHGGVLHDSGRAWPLTRASLKTLGIHTIGKLRRVVERERKRQKLA